RRDLAARAVEPLVGGLEAAADDALLDPGLAFGELAVGREAGELRARPGAAGRAVVRLARAQHEVARARGGRGRPEQLHVIDVGKSLRVHRLADAPAGVGQRLHVFDFENLAVVLDEEKQVAAPRNIAGDAAEARHLDAHAFLPPPARHVLDRDLPVSIEKCGHDANRRVDAVLARLDASHVRERDHQADGAVAAHADHADVVEVDDAGGAGLVCRLDEQRTDDHVRAARLVDARRAVAVELPREALAPLGQAAAAEVRHAVDHHAGGLAAGMRVDDADLLHYCGSTPSSLASLPNCSISVRITRVNSSGVLPTGCSPALTRRSLTSGSLSAFTVSAWSLRTASCGVPRGASSPSHCEDSKPG